MTSYTNRAAGTATQLCDYTSAILGQMSQVIQPYVSSQSGDYAAHVGAHMRHIIEHYDALVQAFKSWKAGAELRCHADYDARERNLEVETNPLEAIRRIGLIVEIFGSNSGMKRSDMECVVEVYIRGGLNGEYDFCTQSSVARELMFLNSHATHHFAILQGYAKQRGQTLGAGFGRAPATVAYEKQLQQREVAA